MKNFLLALLLFLTGCVTGSHVLTGPARPQISADAVKVYSTMPKNAETIGVVSAFSINGWTWQQAMESATRRLKSEAAQIGANGIVVTAMENDYSSGSKISGTAIFIP